MSASERNKTTFIMVGATGTTPEVDIGVAEIRRQDLLKGKFDIGWHFVIRRDGTVETGLPDARVGHFNPDPHMRGCAIGICMVGGKVSKPRARDAFTPAQNAALSQLIRSLRERYPDIDQLHYPTH